MFSYYGSKSKVVHLYPEPKFSLIIEPFAGSAQYSVKFGLNKKVWLNDSYDAIYKVWKYILGATKEQIQNLPEIKKGDDIRKLELSEEERFLLGFCCSNGVSKPGNIVTNYADKTAWPKDDSRYRPHSTWQLTRQRILKNLDLIKDWKVTDFDFKQIPNLEATWFIDPPYQNGGKYYVKNQINYKELADWCLKRNGQVIVCENSGADWLPFKNLSKMRGCKKETMEMVYLQ